MIEFANLPDSRCPYPDHGGLTQNGDSDGNGSAPLQMPMPVRIPILILISILVDLPWPQVNVVNAARGM